MKASSAEVVWIGISVCFGALFFAKSGKTYCVFWIVKINLKSTGGLDGDALCMG